MQPKPNSAVGRILEAIEDEIEKIDKVIHKKPTCKSRWINGYLDGLKTARNYIRDKAGEEEEP